MPKLIVVTGPTGSGKTALAIELAQRLDCHILSADSRQIYRGIPITTAAPTAEELRAAPHHFVGELELGDYYSAAQYESDALKLLDELFKTNDYAIMCGGSMMYVDAVVRGIDELPTISDEVRRKAYDLYGQYGIEGIREELLRLDPIYYNEVDLNNHKRLVHAVEICWQSGTTYSSLRTGQVKSRPFEVVRMAIDLPRDELFARINRRVELMVENGMIDEARSVYHLRCLNSLNTVGFKEMFDYLDGKSDLPFTIAKIQKNTRVYAKKQLTWLKKHPNTIMLKPATSVERIINNIIDGE